MGCSSDKVARGKEKKNKFRLTINVDEKKKRRKIWRYFWSIKEKKFDVTERGKRGMEKKGGRKGVKEGGKSEKV